MVDHGDHRYLPDADRLSILSATILLAYTLARFIQFPSQEIGVQLPGLYLAFTPNIYTIIALIVAGLTATGANNILHTHPLLGSERTIGHWILPALTAWVIGLPLFQLPLSPLWWLGFTLGGALLMGVLVAEFITVYPDDARYLTASIGLITVAFALFLALTIALRIVGTRLLMIVPALALAAGLVSLRVLHLRQHEKWQYANAAVTALVIGQFAAAFHYWPLSPVSYGLVVLGLAYSLTSFLGNLAEGEKIRQAIIEPLIVLIIILISAAVFN